jgi:hypothetical protein
MFAFNILNSNVVYKKSKDDGTVFMFPKARDYFALDVSMFAQTFL